MKMEVPLLFYFNKIDREEEKQWFYNTVSSPSWSKSEAYAILGISALSRYNLPEVLNKLIELF